MTQEFELESNHVQEEIDYPEFLEIINKMGRSCIVNNNINKSGDIEFIYIELTEDIDIVIRCLYIYIKEYNNIFYKNILEHVLDKLKENNEHDLIKIVKFAIKRYDRLNIKNTIDEI